MAVKKGDRKQAGENRNAAAPGKGRRASTKTLVLEGRFWYIYLDVKRSTIKYVNDNSTRLSRNGLFYELKWAWKNRKNSAYQAQQWESIDSDPLNRSEYSL